MIKIKGAFIIICLLSVTVRINCQPFGDAAPGYRIIRQEYENSSGEKAFTRFNYNCNGSLVKGFWSLTDRSRFSVNHYDQDENGNLVLAYREFSDGLTSAEIFNFDSLGNKTGEHFYRSDGITGSASYYYEDQLLAGADYKNHKGWLKVNTVFSYDDKKRRTGAELKQGSQVIGKIGYEYDSVHNLVREKWEFGDSWSQTFFYHYEKTGERKIYYSSPFLSPLTGFRIKSENYTFNDEKGGPSRYYYDNSGLLSKKVFTRSDSISTQTFYKYDIDQRLTESIRCYSNRDTARFTYTYNGCGRLILRDCYRGDTIAGIEMYFYDNEGGLRQAYLKNFDNWLTGTIIFKLDELGNIHEGKFKGEDGFDATLTFNYYKEKLVSGIKWEYTFGKFQQYWFEYEPLNSK